MKSRNPDPPQLIKGTGGKTAQGGSTLHSFMAKQIAVKNKDDHIDPRERILRHAKVSFNIETTGYRFILIIPPPLEIMFLALLEGEKIYVLKVSKGLISNIYFFHK